MSRARWIVFDLNGTLLDPREIGPDVLDEGGLPGDLLLVDAKAVTDESKHALFNGSHDGTSS